MLCPYHQRPDEAGWLKPLSFQISKETISGGYFSLRGRRAWNSSHDHSVRDQETMGPIWSRGFRDDLTPKSAARMMSVTLQPFARLTCMALWIAKSPGLTAIGPSSADTVRIVPSLAVHFATIRTHQSQRIEKLSLVSEAGFEPAWDCSRRILSLPKSNEPQHSPTRNRNKIDDLRRRA